MKSSIRIPGRIIATVLFVAAPLRSNAQGFNTPLTMQGLHQAGTHSAAARGAGGTSFINPGSVSQLFSNPASLTAIAGIQAAATMTSRSQYIFQDQRYGGLQGFSAFGPLMEGTTGELSDPDTTNPAVTRQNQWTQADSVQRPFDQIGPNWSTTRSKRAPIQAMVAVPIDLDGFKIVAAAGMVEYVNLNTFYQNNNGLSPSVISVLNGTISTNNLPTTDATTTALKQPYLTQWYQYSQQRDGSIMGYGGSLAAVPAKNLSVGVSVLLLKGSSDDHEIRTGRGRLVFFNQSLRLDKVGMVSFDKSGTSDFSGTAVSAGFMYAGKNVNAGVSLQLPTTIKRSFSYAISKDSVSAVKWGLGRMDSLHVLTTATITGEDQMRLPLRGSAGLALKVREDVTIALDYEVRATGSAVYTNVDGVESKPWNSTSILHVGTEFRAATWCAIRAGVTNYEEVLEPTSNPLRGEAVNYPVYSVGLGLAYEGIRFDLAYEYSDAKFVDTWSNSASINRTFGNTMVASISYELPW